jgi:hypothetical protein
VIDPDFGEVSRFPAPVRWVGTKVGRSGGEGALLEWWEGSELTKVRRRLAPDVRAPGEARAFVASQCPGLSAEAMDVLRLLTTEIVDNAMWHAAPGPLWLDVEAERSEVGGRAVRPLGCGAGQRAARETGLVRDGVAGRERGRRTAPPPVGRATSRPPSPGAYRRAACLGTGRGEVAPRGRPGFTDRWR